MNFILNYYKLNIILIFIFSIYIMDTNSFNKKRNGVRNPYKIKNIALTSSIINNKKNDNIHNNGNTHTINHDIDIDENLINSLSFKHCIKKLKEFNIKYENNKLICIRVCKNARKLNLTKKNDINNIITYILNNSTTSH